MRIARLADHPGAICQLARWFRAQWPDHYGSRSAAEIEDDFRASSLPILLAFEGSEMTGTVALRAHALDGVPQLAPGLGGLYVASAHRNRRIGTELVRAGMRVAGDLGYPALYVASAHAGKIFEQLGWETMPSVMHNGEAMAIYRWSRERFCGAAGLRI
jgi:predicted N-acetyltransferase YhbS